MLKKLAKYGNSTTLVIDKAILELLNMDESSMVKLQTDGKSLIVTPVSSLEKNNVSYTLDEAMQAAKAGELKKMENNSVNPAQFQEMSSEFQREVFQKNSTASAFAQLGQRIASHKEFQEASALLAQQCDPHTQSAEYLQGLHALKVKYFPELAEMDKDLVAVVEKYKNIK